MTDKELYKRVFQRFRASEQTRDYIMNMAKEKSFPAKGRKRFAVIVVAAALIVAVPLTALAATNTNLAGWFDSVWHAVTGAQLNEVQTNTITKMTSDVGQSKTVNGTTVTVDSLLLGSDDVHLMLDVKVPGANLDSSMKYGFEHINVSAKQGQSDSVSGPEGFSIESYTVDKAKSEVNLVVDYNTSLPKDGDLNGRNITLQLKNFGTGSPTDFTVVTQGDWSFDIPLQRASKMKTLSLGDANVMGYIAETEKMSPIEFHNIRINETGLSYEYDAQNISYIFEITAVLKDGTKVATGNGSGYISADGKTWTESYQWLVPINVDDLKSIMVYNTEIPIG